VSALTSQAKVTTHGLPLNSTLSSPSWRQSPPHEIASASRRGGALSQRGPPERLALAHPAIALSLAYHGISWSHGGRGLKAFHPSREPT
jgi:hypothetical protein